METSVRLELLVGQQVKKTNLKKKSPKKAIALCGEKFSTLSGEGVEIPGYGVRCWAVQRQLSVSSPALPLWEQSNCKVCKKNWPFLPWTHRESRVFHMHITILLLFIALRVGWHLPVPFYIASLVSGVLNLSLIIISVCGVCAWKLVLSNAGFGKACLHTPA